MADRYLREGDTAVDVEDGDDYDQYNISDPASVHEENEYSQNEYAMNPMVKKNSYVNGKKSSIALDYDNSETADIDLRARSATNLYGSASNKLSMGRNLQLSTGQRIDYIIVYQLPLSEHERNALDQKVAQPPAKEEDTAVKNARKRVDYETNLVNAGLYVEKELSSDHRTVYLKIHAPFDVLLYEAEANKLKMRLSEQEQQQRVDEGLFSQAFANKMKGMFTLPKWMKLFDTGIEEDPDFFSAVFKVKNLTEFHNYENEDEFFTGAQRSSLVLSILNRVRYSQKKAEQFGIKRLINNKAYIDCFPLHDGPFEHDGNGPIDRPLKVRAKLYENWGRFSVLHKRQPLDLVRHYFGEKVGIYFVWLGFYTRWLIFPAIIGLAIFIYGIVTFNDQKDAEELCFQTNFTMCPLCGSCDVWYLSSSCTPYKFAWVFDNGATIAFAFIMSVWASIFLDFWKRQNAVVAFDWDTRDFTADEPDRPQFKAKETRRNPVTDEEEKYYPAYKRLISYLTSIAVVVSMIAVVIMVVISIIVYRLAIRVALFPDKNAGVVAAITASIIQLITIIILNRIYGSLAIWLTNVENHRKESEYESNLAFKIFLFQFVNSYSSLFYVAFFKGKFSGYPGHYTTFFGFRQDECAEYGCLLELTIQLSIIMVGKQTINNLQEVILPELKKYMAKRRLAKNPKTKNVLLPWEEEFQTLGMYPPMGMFYEYLEMIVQFGFITLFVTAFPLGPLFALGNNILEIRVDAGKLCTDLRRPVAERASSIGIWEGIMQFVSFFSVITNGLVIAITSNYITKLVYMYDHDGSLEGYIAKVNPRSPVPIDVGGNSTYCHYSSLRDSDTGAKGAFFYEVWASRCGFLIIFEHVVFFTKLIVQAIIPDIPKFIRLQIAREAHFAKKALESKLEGDENARNNPGTMEPVENFTDYPVSF